MFRFSLKWILAAMVYAAIAAAAFSQQSWVYSDLLCAASLLALGYAVVLIIYSRGARQAAAVGFAVFMILLAVCIQAVPESVPTLRILTAAGINGQELAPLTPAAPMPATGMATFSSAGTIATGNLNFTPSTTVWAAPTLYPISSLTGNVEPIIKLKLRAANAVATMVIGLLGCLLGVLAFHRAQRAKALV
jgi:hypothetical protein